MSLITDYRIVISENASTNEMRAASFIREHIKLVCSKKIALVRDSEAPVPLEIVVGKTNREELDGIEFSRSRDGVWEYVLFSKGTRLYVTGLGVAPEEEPPYNTAYRKLDDGCVGTVYAAYHFVEDVLGYEFVYSTYDEFPEAPELEMPADYQYYFTREHFRKQRPQHIEGAALYSPQCSERIDWNTGCFILKTKEGKLIVIDGGHTQELPRLVACLQTISGEDVPTVEAWLFSHMHGDHYGAYYRLSTDPEFKGAVKVKKVYCNFLSREFLTTTGREPQEAYGNVYDVIMNSSENFGAEVYIVQKGDLIAVDEIEFEVIHVPEEQFAKDMNVNDSSVVYKMTYDKGQTIMFLGDAEWVCDNDLVNNCADKLKSDVVQVGHHGCGNVSRRCYELIDADAYIWQCGERFWYGESGEGLYTHNVGFIRYRSFMKEIGVKNENVYVSIDKIDSFPLPMPIY